MRMIKCLGKLAHTSHRVLDTLFSSYCNVLFFDMETQLYERNLMFSDLVYSKLSIEIFKFEKILFNYL